ncbi:polysaccharide pyruvyl transferase family protein [Paenibacillus alkaliterrae]|uniref:polysaccharide pyruvyl transferase family protein n=1 Tax=Paenibacillus alkaliterrae TaxID=320909 RepID=UPI001F1972D5|nr:polysaccharide pyruvyl transferase family protein [Paenibacillus alkaliterrae]MCF2937412.1 polysaccharide pyruvyl transferase family protein [Paenibacillus alkaliterrae]
MRIMMFAHGGSLNRGCEAIVRSSTKLIKEEINGAKVYLASDKPHTDKVIPSLDEVYDGSKSDLRKYSFNWFISSLQYKLLKNETYALGIIEQKIINRIKDMDVCLSIGGDNYCYGEQPNWYEIDRRIKAQGKKLVLWGCSIGEEDMSERKLRDLQLFDLILARETLTYNMLKNKGLHNVRLCADPAFTMEQEELVLPEGWQEGNTIGINFSPLVWKRNKNSKEAVTELIKHILTNSDMTIALTPHVVDHGNNDYEALKNFHEEFKNTGRIILLPDHLTAVQYKGYIARMRFFIGARTHATIAAYSNYVPTMVLGYSVKSKGIAKDIFDEEKLVLGIEDISNSSKLIGCFNEMIREEEAIRKRLKKSIPQIKKMSYKAVEYLRELC